MLKPEHPEQTDCRVCSGLAAQTKQELTVTSHGCPRLPVGGFVASSTARISK
jgi:hypothetical protein